MKIKKKADKAWKRKFKALMNKLDEEYVLEM